MLLLKQQSLIILFAVYALTATAADLQLPKRDFAGKEAYAVKKVVAVEVLTLSVNGKEETVRLCGIRASKAESSDKSRLFLEEFLKGESLWVESEGNARDKDGRLLVYAYRSPDGLFLNYEMLRQGVCELDEGLTFGLKPVLAEAEEHARKKAKGRWTSKVEPSEFAIADLPPPNPDSTALGKECELLIEAGLVYNSGDVKPVARTEFFLLDANFADITKEVDEFSPGMFGIAWSGADRDPKFKDVCLRIMSVVDKHTKAKATTDFQGKASFAPVQQGTYYIMGIVSFPGPNFAVWNVKVELTKESQRVFLDNHNAETFL